MALRIVIFGQAAFGRDVMLRLIAAGHEVVGVHAPPDRGRPDPLAAEAESRGIRTLRHGAFRRGGVAIAERVDEIRTLGADLHVMPYTTVILPPEIVDAPRHGSLCFHPSLLPRFRGGAAIPWQIILGERETGVTVFRPDAGVDTGPIALQRGGIEIGPADTAGSLYFDRLYPAGVEAMVDAVERIDGGDVRFEPQDESRATFQGLLTEPVAAIDFRRSAIDLDRLVRGCDPQPGAHALRGADLVRLFDARLESETSSAPPGTIIAVDSDAMRVSLAGGLLRVARVRVNEGKKGRPRDLGLVAGDRLESAAV